MGLYPAFGEIRWPYATGSKIRIRQRCQSANCVVLVSDPWHYGFEGVSVKHLADATGLEKASLYYRCPGGKDEIVMAVAKRLA
jgi:Bacterial regulatory proteins, tetR family